MYVLALLWYLMLVLVKCLWLLALLITLLVFYDSHHFITSPRETKYLEERSANRIPKDYPLTSMIYVMYTRMSFDITYNKVKTGSFFSRPKFTLSLFLKTFVAVTFGVSRLFINLTLVLLKVRKHDSLEAFLLTYCTQHTQTRRVLYYGRKWYTNPGQNGRLAKAIGSIMQGSPKAQVEEMLRMANRFVGEDGGLSNMTTTQAALKFKPGVLGQWAKVHQSHIVWFGLAKRPGDVVYGTDLNKAQSSSNYGRECALNEYDGGTKPTRGLVGSLDEFSYVDGKVIRVGMSNLYTGAILHGYNEKVVDAKFAQQAENFKDNAMSLDILNAVTPKQKEAIIQAIFEERARIIDGASFTDIGSWDWQQR